MSDQNSPQSWDDSREPHDEPAPEYLNRWLMAQRWYSGSSRSPLLHIVAQWTLANPDPGVEIRTLLVRNADGDERTLHQVPLTIRSLAVPTLEGALIAIVHSADGTPRYVYDAPHDPAYASALLRFMLQEETFPEYVDVNAPTTVRGERIAGVGVVSAHPTVVASRVLVGEQSNTSVILDLADNGIERTRPVICKIFRTINPGANPDVVVQSALARADSRFIPEPVGYLAAEWPDRLRPDGRAFGHLAFAQEFFPDVSDAWRTALLAAAAGEDFTERARRLGEAVAEVHTDLAEAMPTLVASPRIMVAMVAAMLDRFRSATADVPDLAGIRTDVENIFARALTVAWPRLQHIHGDLHLGQVLDVPGRGWILLDFEGEPMRTLAERDQPDVPIRDVAGLLRSFSYVAATVTRDHPELDPARIATWAAAARRAVLQGYSRGSGLTVDDHDPLLEAFELDKAVYETVYETRNRPSWLPVPLAAVHRLASSDARSRNDQD
ncbi:hypothetical protein [Cryobacterium sp. MLB-32]|uniref:maltokinase N-terminal cap-like domain-containing protein n=1 Tax=Cryobacterium sp. MLB-32 TaxID=1529318 RepID=UPI000690FADC|nr:hypothetical protein [Cryobacterium sp. MLB-32]